MLDKKFSQLNFQKKIEKDEMFNIEFAVLNYFLLTNSISMKINEYNKTEF